MATVVEVLNRIARQVSVDVPDSWITTTETEHVEIRDDFLMETLDDVQERVDAPAPYSAQYTLAGTGAETYDLPADFKRLHRDRWAVYETTTTRRALIPITDDGQWTYLKEMGSTGAERYYRLSGYPGAWQISIYRAPTSAQSVVISYMRDVWMATSGGTAGSAFTDATDVLLYPRRLIEAGTVARWRERKGLNPADKFAEYESELEKFSVDLRGRRLVSFGDARGPSYPFNIPVPDFIPPGP